MNQRRPGLPLWSPDDPLGHFIPDGTEPCRGHTPTFYATARGGEKYAAEATETAKRLCGGCHRRFECHSKAVYRQERYGVWGGVDFYERYHPTAIATRRKSERRRQERESKERGA